MLNAERIIIGVLASSIIRIALSASYPVIIPHRKVPKIPELILRFILCIILIYSAVIFSAFSTTATYRGFAFFKAGNASSGQLSKGITNASCRFFNTSITLFHPASSRTVLPANITYSYSFTSRSAKAIAGNKHTNNTTPHHIFFILISTHSIFYHFQIPSNSDNAFSGTKQAYRNYFPVSVLSYPTV